ncbi:unnamed protein product, partial [Gongylonema pulchrum]
MLLAAWFIFLHRQGSFAAQTPVIDVITAFFSSIRHHNLASSLSTVALDQIRAASIDALTKINFFNEFDSLFVRNHPFEDAFDQYIRISLPRTYQEDVFREMYSTDCISSCNDGRSIFVRKLTPLLKEALSERIMDFDFCIPNSQESPMWDVHEKPAVCLAEDDVSVLLGLRLAPKWNSPLTRGPPAKSAEAAHFREFWGDRCELRKYPDNAICETVAWNSPDVPLLIC